MKATLQTHQSTIMNIDHNERKIKVPHADKEYGDKNNWYWENNKTEKEFYNETFENDWKKRNERQTRKDRKYDCSYLEYLKTKQLKGKETRQQMITAGETNYNIKKATRGIKPTSHEMVVGIGNINDNPEFGMYGEKQEVAKEILQKYILSFNERNKGNVVLYNACIHTEEKGITHAHMDFCFVSENKHGEKEVSQTAALKRLGFIDDSKSTNTKKRQNAITKWRDNEREILKQLCKEYDIEIINGEHGKKHLEKEEYQQQQDRQKLEQQKMKIQKQHEENIRTETKIIQQAQEYNKFINKSPHGQAFNKYYEDKHYQQRDNRVRAEINNYWKEYQSNSEMYWSRYRTQKETVYNALKDTNRELKQVSYELNRTLSSISFLNAGLLTFLYRVITAVCLFFNKKELERQARELEKYNAEIIKTRKMVSQYQKEAKTALKNEDREQIKKALENWENAVNGVVRDLQYQIEIEENTILKNEDIEINDNNIGDDVLGL